MKEEKKKEVVSRMTEKRIAELLHRILSGMENGLYADSFWVKQMHDDISLLLERDW